MKHNNQLPTIAAYFSDNSNIQKQETIPNVILAQITNTWINSNQGPAYPIVTGISRILTTSIPWQATYPSHQQKINSPNPIPVREILTKRSAYCVWCSSACAKLKMKPEVQQLIQSLPINERPNEEGNPTFVRHRAVSLGHFLAHLTRTQDDGMHNLLYILMYNLYGEIMEFLNSHPTEVLAADEAERTKTSSRQNNFGPPFPQNSRRRNRNNLY